MIIEIPLSDKPFHHDPEWKNWSSFLQWMESINADYFLIQLMSDHLLKKRFKAFLEAAIVYEKTIQKQLENELSFPNQPLPMLQIPFRPQHCPSFNTTYGTWEAFAEMLVSEHKDLRAFHKKLRFSRSFRKEVMNFLKDAFTFEDELARKLKL